MSRSSVRFRPSAPVEHYSRKRLRDFVFYGKHWIALAEAGNPDVLVIGNKVVGTDQWVLKTDADTWKQLDGQGNILVAELSVTFEEYMSQ